MGWTDPSGKLVGLRVLKNLEQVDGGWSLAPEMPDKPVAPPRQPSSVPRSKFEQLVSQWQRDTEHFSLLVDKLTHPSYMRIIGLGQPVISQLIEDLPRNPSYWGLALYAISGENPVPDADAGDARKIADAWIAWGRKNGY